MHFVIALIIGGIIGWIAGMVMRDQGGTIWNVPLLRLMQAIDA